MRTHNLVYFMHWLQERTQERAVSLGDARSNTSDKKTRRTEQLVFNHIVKLSAYRHLGLVVREISIAAERAKSYNLRST